MIIMTRRVSFAAAHADWLPSLSENENQEIFGAQASPEPYGHDYLLEVSVAGSIDQDTGILVNIKEIDRIVKMSVIRQMDRQFLNRRIGLFERCPVTLENMAALISDQLVPLLPSEVELARIRLAHSQGTQVVWTSDRRFGRKESGTMQMTRQYEFSASHRLHSAALSEEQNRELFGKCNYANGHGHNYELEVTVAGPVDERSGRVFSPDLLDQIVNREIVERYDHRHLNLDIPEFSTCIPSAEIITRVIWERLCQHIVRPAVLYRILLRETARNIFEYYGEEVV